MLTETVIDKFDQEGVGWIPWLGCTSTKGVTLVNKC